ncbi:VPS10 domain-containing receptor SorCS3 [Liparis tanakae]|uniref:VPS10 domain-containing receptor SorCS3 n=1 Tax=Liparis tanakae TaxID=230148 RepID=A0A4Z2IJ98_9TELE|nr:VPS10 domain-containing receptor SorCS3 [Liparis tanakae]
MKGTCLRPPAGPNGSEHLNKVNSHWEHPVTLTEELRRCLHEGPRCATQQTRKVKTTPAFPPRLLTILAAYYLRIENAEGSNKLICFHLSMPVMLLLGFHGLQTGQPAEWGPPNKRRKPQGVPTLGFGSVPVEAVTLLITVQVCGGRLRTEGLHLSLGIWLVIAAQTIQHAKAEITCASCASPVQLHVEELELGMSTDPTEEPGTLKHIRLEFRELAVPDQNTEVDADHETVVSVEDVPQFPQHVSLIGVSAKEDASGSSEVSPRGSERAGEPEKSEGAALRRAKRSGPEFSEFSENGRTGRTSMEAGAPEDRGSLFDGHKQGKSGFRWNREEARGNNRQDEPKLTSSTFSLSGDSAHNHAVVYWSGQNSSPSKANSKPAAQQPGVSPGPFNTDA